MNKVLENTLKRIIDEAKENNQINVSSPDYEQVQVDYLVNNGLLTKIDCSTMTGWQYIVYLTYEGEHYFENEKKERKKVIWDNVKFFIPIVVSIASLIISIVK